MTKASLIAVGCMAILAAGANGGTGSRPGEIVIRVRFGNVPLLSVAEDQAARVLSQAGVRVRWERLTSSGQREGGSRECSWPVVDITVIDLEILDEEPKSDHPGALGYAKPFQHSGVRVVIFYDRVVAMQKGPKMLGHVIAHEVGHMLIGTNSHSESGVMRAFWQPRDVQSLKHYPLPFTEADVDLIAVNLARQGKSCMVAPAALPLVGPSGPGDRSAF